MKMIAVDQVCSEITGLGFDGPTPDSLDGVEVATGAACTPQESKRFLQSLQQMRQVQRGASSGPSAQDIECLRQAAWKFRLETGSDEATATDLFPVLQRLGYA